jgi:hypothetical protein
MGLRYLQQRNGTYYFRRAVPARIRHLVGQREFKVSLRTRDRGIAAAKYGQVDQEIEKRIFLLENGQQDAGPDWKNDPARLAQMRKRLGLDGKPTIDPQRQSEAAFFEAMTDALGQLSDGAELNPVAVVAALTDRHERIRLSEIPDLYFKLTGYAHTHLNARELSKKQAPVRRAYHDLVDDVGNLFLKDLTRSKAKVFVAKLRSEVEAGVIRANTANKKIIHIRKCIKALIDERDLPIANPFDGLKLKETVRSRPPFSMATLRTILSPEALLGLDGECQGLLMAMADTGANLKELCSLNPDDQIFLEEAV